MFDLGRIDTQLMLVPNPWRFSLWEPIVESGDDKRALFSFYGTTGH